MLVTFLDTVFVPLTFSLGLPVAGIVVFIGVIILARSLASTDPDARKTLRKRGFWTIAIPVMILAAIMAIWAASHVLSGASSVQQTGIEETYVR